MKPTPPGWPRIASSLHYREAGTMIDWLCQAFGFEVQLKIEGEDGRLEHSELRLADGLIMVCEERMGDFRRFQTDGLSPLTAKGNTQSLMLYIDDVDAHCVQARAAGGRIVAEPELHDYGVDYWADRSYGVLDPQGHLWWFSQRIRG